MANVKGSYGRFACIPDEYSEQGGKLLLAQRSDGRWNLPGGGVDEKDAEMFLSSAAILGREVMEETGLGVLPADYRPIGEYATAKHTDVAITYHCKVIAGQLKATEESRTFKYATPSEVLELAKIGDVAGGLVGGLKTSTGGVPRHIQMCLHYFTRVCINEFYRLTAMQYCAELGIPE